jgi:hypothetical protein
MKATFRNAAIGCVLLAACGRSPSKTDGGPITGPIALDDYADAVVTAICQRAVDCSLYPDVATCAATRDIVGSGPVDAIALVKSGRAHYDPAAAAACIDALPRECWAEIDWMFAEWRFFATPLCRRVFQGTVPPGGACCNSAECTTEVCFAVGGCSLEPLVPVGGTCDNVNLLCDVGRECGTDSKCAVPPPSGVILPDEGQPCDWNIPNPCRRFDDYCDPDTDVCTRRIQPGAPCTSIEFPCVRYAGCTNGVCTSSPGLGAYCAAEGACIGGLTCINNVCSAWPTPSPGTCGL